MQATELENFVGTAVKSQSMAQRMTQAKEQKWR